jgi:DNA-directed RNA polymerase specialized sigma24 family protein
VDRITLLDAIRRLPSEHAVAAMLHWVEGREVRGGKESVTGIMGLSFSAVYKLLREARAMLKSDPDIREMRSGEA